jgi:endonuclease/exonuclease/phosphatase (EEP) superfamily protein YafD
VERPLDVFFTIAALAPIVATLLPFFRSGAWWIRIFDFPRIQIAIIGALILVADVVLRRDAGLSALGIRSALGLAILYQAYKIWPYTLLARRQVEPAKQPRDESTLSLLLANVQIENRSAALLRKIIADADPDVILIVEADAWWQNELRRLGQSHPFTVQQPQDNSYGLLLFSRFELSRAEIRFLIENDVPSIRAGIRLPAGSEVELHGLHPRPPVPQETAQSTERDAELMVVGKEIKGKEPPIVVFGDLNDVAWSPTTLLFQKISGLVDPRVGRGLFNSFHARYFFLRFPLDHFFHSTHFRLIALKRLPFFGSDHFPMYIRLSYEPEAQQRQEAPDARESDHAEATEKIAQARPGDRA